METWDEMSIRHSSERKAMEKKQQEDWDNLKQTNASAIEELMLAEKIKQEDKAMTTQHYAEAKMHNENPELKPDWDDHFRPKQVISMEEFMDQQKSGQEKLMDELREAVAKEKSTPEIIQEENEKRLLERIRDQNSGEHER